MQDNFTGDTGELLIRYMDGELSADEKATVESLLQTSESAREQYGFFVAAKHSVRSQGIRQRVARIQHEYLEESKPAESIPIPKKKPSSFARSFMSAAAILIFLLVGYTTFQYFATTNQSVYNDAYLSYQLPVNRGNNKAAGMETLYNAGNYKAVISSFSATSAKSQKEYFIAGLAYLQLNEATEAVQSFKNVGKLNSVSDKKQYVQETDYYLMLAYLKAGKIGNAEQKLDQIRSDKDHLFYEKAASISRTKLMILKWKEKK